MSQLGKAPHARLDVRAIRIADRNDRQRLRHARSTGVPRLRSITSLGSCSVLSATANPVRGCIRNRDSE